ncbi:MAG: Glycosyl transferase, group 2 family [Nitrospira sp.]|jgi:GT2 family glycosyltransferase|nr:MAG: Glycosyl transferase, group 2 family [Nitrospira sp.]
MNPVNDERHLENPSHSSQSERLTIRWFLGRVKGIFESEGAWTCLRKGLVKLLSLASGQLSALPFSLHQRDKEYKVWRKRHSPSSESLHHMRSIAERLIAPQVITVILMVSRVDEKGLRETIESIRAQVYPYWRLLVISEFSPMSMLERVVGSYSVKDHRIQLKTAAILKQGAACVLQHVQGEFVGFLSEDCFLSPEAIFSMAMQLQESSDLDFLYCDEDTARAEGEFVDPFFKPSWSPDLLIGMNYVGRFNIIRKQILSSIGGDWGDIVNDGLYHLVLRSTEETNKICRIPKVLCHCRTIRRPLETSSESDQSRNHAQMKSIRAALIRRGERADVLCVGTGRFKVTFHPLGMPLVSIIIPTRDRWDMLQRCIQSIEKLTTYPSYEIIIVDNESRDLKAQEYLKVLSRKWSVHRFPGPFNFSQINNYGASKARGEFLLFLNDDTQVISPDWLTVMVAQAQRIGVGAVGAKLLYPTGRIQHAGVVLGIRGIAGHAFRHLRGDVDHYHGLPHIARNCSAVTGACTLLSARLFSKIGGFECRLKVEYNDVDLCLRLICEGYRIIYTPDAMLIHHENASRKGGRSREDAAFFISRWGASIQQGDPYYNPQLTCSREDWSIQV